MKKPNVSLTFLGVASFVACVLPAQTPHVMEEFTVKVYNLAGVPGDVLAQAKQTAAWIFHDSGIELLWVDCSLSREDRHDLQACTGVKDATSAIVKILPHVMAERSGIPQTKLGAAVPPNQVFILFDRIQNITPDTGFSRPRVLGHIMAHELGHLLLLPEDHSARGIMTGKLVSRDCERPGIMLLRFTKDQGERMRKRLQRKSGLAVVNTESSIGDDGLTPQLTIRMYSYREISSWVLVAAEAEAERKLRPAHVGLRWINCGTIGPSGSCADPELPSELVVRIIPKAFPRASTTALGIASWSEGSSSAYIFYDRVIALRTHTKPLEDILGRVLAHEVVHLLLPQESHSGVGLMRGQWSADDLRVTSPACTGLPVATVRLIQQEALRRAFSTQALASR